MASCQECGSSCQGKYCSLCEQIQANEKLYGDSVDLEDGDAE